MQVHLHMDPEEPCIGRAEYKLYSDFQLCGGLAPLTPALFTGQLYFFFLLLSLCLKGSLPKNCAVAQGAKTLRESHISGEKNWEKESLRARECGRNDMHGRPRRTCDLKLP